MQLVGLCIAIALLPFAMDWRSPMLASYRPAALLVLIAVPLVLMSIAAWTLRTSRSSAIRGAPSVAMLLVATAALITTLSLETQFHCVRARVLAADPVQLARARPASYRRLSRCRRNRSTARAPCHCRRVRRRPQCRRTFRGRRPPANRILAGRSPAPGPTAAVDRDRPRGRCSLAHVAALAAAAFDRVGRRSSCRGKRAQGGGPRLRAHAGPRAGAPRDQSQFRAGCRSRQESRQSQRPLHPHPRARDLGRPDDRHRGRATVLPGPSRSRRALHAQAFPRSRIRSTRTRTSKPVTCGFRSINSSAAIGSLSVRSWATAPSPC
jgi:hypothetical protein